jgi:membrane associated rhomboid family serine protease
MEEVQATDGDARPGIADDPARGTRFPVGFTRDEGWPGWILAKLRRQRFFGLGAIEIQGEHLIIQGQERTWLGIASRGHYLIERRRLVNALRFRNRVRLRWKRAPFGTRSMEFHAQSDEDAASIVTAAVADGVSQQDEAWLAVQSFHERTRMETPIPWVTAALGLASCVVFVSMLVNQGALVPFDVATLIAWGANTSSETLGGEWWRLLTALFLHGDLLHLVLNMWVLLQVGRLTERIYGRWAFLAIYVAAGCVGGLASLLWKSPVVTVGASGAIFGVVGAFLVSLKDRSSVPGALASSYWVSTLIFVVYNLLVGASTPVVDNAAHVGGLISGALFGYGLLRHWRDGVRLPPAGHRLLIGFGLPVVVLGLAFNQTSVVGRELSTPERYWKTHQWFLQEQTRALRAEGEFSYRARSGAFSDLQLKEHVESAVLKPWKAISKRLATDPATAYGDAVKGFVAAKVEWAEALTTALDSGKRKEDLEDLGNRVRGDAARLQRLDLRATLSQRPRTLASLPAFTRFRDAFDKRSTQCVRAPVYYGPQVAPADSRSDGPAMADAQACSAQALFLAGRYPELDKKLQSSLSANKRLPGGGSAYLTMLGGLDKLFSYGTMKVEEALKLTSDWRTAVPESVHAELAEASLLDAWAWSARGNGTANTVSAQNWQLFAVRLEMAAAALEEIEVRARDNPAWYEQKLSLGLSRGEKDEQMATVFSDSIARFPDELNLYQQRIRSLMPRWSGSHAKVRMLIESANANSADPQSNERYAELYAIDAYLEGEQTNFFEDTDVDWARMKEGLMAIQKRYPQSDYALNRLAHFACMAEDKQLYAWSLPQLAGRDSATAWRNGVTRAGCDKKFAK